MAQPVNMADIMALSIPERIILVEEIWDSIAAEQEATPLTPEQLAEIDQRIDEWEASPKTGALMGGSEGSHREGAISPRVAISPRGQSDLHNAWRWYEDQRARARRQIYAARRRGTRPDLRQPRDVSEVATWRPLAVFYQFPCGILYRVEDGDLVVLGVIHGRRGPGKRMEISDMRERSLLRLTGFPRVSQRVPETSRPAGALASRRRCRAPASA